MGPGLGQLIADCLPVWMGLIICGFIVLLFFFWFVRGCCRAVGKSVEPPPPRASFKPKKEREMDLKTEATIFLAGLAWKQAEKRLFKKKSPKKKSFWEK